MQNDQTRRTVLKTAMALPFSAVRGSAANSAVTVRLIGSGGRGAFDAGWLVQNPDARLAALCDIFDDRIERAKAKIPIADSAHEPVTPRPTNADDRIRHWTQWRDTFGDIMDHCDITLTYPGGVRGILTGTQFTPKEAKPENTAIRAAESILTVIMATMAVDRKREVPWEEMMKS